MRAVSLVDACIIPPEGIAIKNCPMGARGSEMQGEGRGWVSLSVFVAVGCFFLPFFSTTVGNFQQFSISMCHRHIRKYSW